MKDKQLFVIVDYRDIVRPAFVPSLLKLDRTGGEIVTRGGGPARPTCLRSEARKFTAAPDGWGFLASADLDPEGFKVVPADGETAEAVEAFHRHQAVNAAQAPHVDAMILRVAKDRLRGLAANPPADPDALNASLQELADAFDRDRPERMATGHQPGLSP